MDFYSSTNRDIDIIARLTLRDGTQLTIAAADIYSYTASGTAATCGIPLGEAVSHSYTLAVARDACRYDAATLDGAEVRVRMGARADNSAEYEYTDAGVWYITDANAPEQSSRLTLKGSDALNLYLDRQYNDAASGYPTTLGRLLALICAIPGVALKTESFVNSAVTVAGMPKWSEGTTLRSIVGYIAACAGGFAQIDPSGQLEIITIGQGSSIALAPDNYTLFTSTGGTKFAFNCLRVTFVSESDDETTAEAVRFAVDSTKTDDATNCVAVESNPLYTEAIAASVCNALKGAEYVGGTLNWLGDPRVMCGHEIQLTALDGDVRRLLVTNRQLTVDGGMSMVCTSAMPGLHDNSTHYSSSGRLFNADGTLPVTRISDFSGGVVEAMLGKFDRMIVGDITADKFGVKFVEATKASVGHLDADSIDADVLRAGSVTAVKIETGTITADRLKAKTITAESGILADGVIGTAQIADGSITSAKVAELNADVITAGTLSAERLVIVGEDGIIYRLNAASSGLTLTELAADEYKNYINGTVIVAKSITAAQIAAQTITGNEILAGSVTAKEIDVSDLFAAEATINALNAMDITGNTYLKLMVTNAVDGLRIGGRNYAMNTGTAYAAESDGSERKWLFPWNCAGEALGKSLYGQTVTVSFDYDQDIVSGTLTMRFNHTWGLVKSFAAGQAEGQRFEGTFELPVPETFAANQPAAVLYLDGTWDGSVTISNLKLETGDKATDWTPAPEDPASGVKTSYIEVADDHIDVSSGGNVNIQAGGSLNVDSAEFNVTTEDFQMSLAKADGEEVVMDIDEDGHTTFKAIHAGNVREAEYDYKIFTTETMGSLSALADYLKRTDARVVEYRMSADEYGSVKLGYYNGYVKIVANSHRLPQIYVDYTFSGTLWITGGYLSAPGTTVEDRCLEAHNGRVMLDNCWFTGEVAYGLYAAHMSEVRWSHTSTAEKQGYTLTAFLWARYGGAAYYRGYIPGGGIWPDTGWVQVSGTPTVVSGDGGSGSGESAASVTGTLGYYGTKNGWHAGECFQGYSNAKGRAYACLTFDLSGVGTIQSAKLTLHRKSGVGLNRKCTVTVYGTTAARGSSPISGMTDAYTTATELVSWDANGTIDVTAAAKALKSGTIAQIVLYTGETGTYDSKAYSYHYAQFDSASMAVTYT